MSERDVIQFEEIEHTADLALHVWGRDLAELLIHAAQGLFHLMRCEPAEDATPTTRRLSLEAPDQETLLVEWLNELLYASETNHECYDQVRVLRLEPQAVEAEISGYQQVASGRSIKAATYSNLHITETAEGYEVVLTFDV